MSHTPPDPKRLVEALLFAADTPLSTEDIASRLPESCSATALLATLQAEYQGRGIELVRRGVGWAFRTAPDLAPHLRLEVSESRRLSRAALETLAIIAYHQPVTRAEIEEIRGVSVSKGTLDMLLEAGWVQPRGRRAAPGRPLAWGTSEAFLDHFSLTSLDDLPGLGELKAAGLLDPRPAIAAYSARGALDEAEDEAEEDEDDDS